MKGYIFYRSFYEAINELPEETRLQLYEALMKYQFDGAEPSLTGIAKALWISFKPQLEANNERQKNGVKGGRPKKETYGFEDEKPMVIENEKPMVIENEEKKEPKEKEKEKEKEKFNTGVFTPEQFSRLKSYRSMLKKPFKTQDAVTRMSNNFSECYALGYSFDDLFKLMAEKQWQSVEAEWVVKINQQTANNPNMTYEQRRLANQKVKVQVFANGNYRDANGDLRDQYGFMS